MTTMNRLVRSNNGSIPNCRLRERIPINKLQTPETPQASSERRQDDGLAWGGGILWNRRGLPNRLRKEMGRSPVTAERCARTTAVKLSYKGSLVANVCGQVQCIANSASEMQEYSSLDSNDGTEEISIQETTPDGVQGPEEDEYPLLELLQTLKQIRRLIWIDLSKTLPQDPGNQGSNGLRHLTRHYENNWTRTSTTS